MLEIHYSTTAGGDETVKTYDHAKDFIAAQLLEVPAFEDYYHVNKAVLDGKEIDLKDKTIGGLFNYLNN